MSDYKDSVINMWQQYKVANNIQDNDYEAWHFCDNQKDADELAILVKDGQKRATASLQISYTIENEPLPQVGTHNLITDWDGNAVCIIRTTSVELRPFNQVTAEFAFIEGEGDKSLQYWKKVHKEAFTRELASYGKAFDENMIVVCETFEVVFK